MRDAFFAGGHTARPVVARTSSVPSKSPRRRHDGVKDGVIEITETDEEAVVAMHAHVVEEVVVRKESTAAKRSSETASANGR